MFSWSAWLSDAHFLSRWYIFCLFLTPPEFNYPISRHILPPWSLAYVIIIFIWPAFVTTLVAADWNYLDNMRLSKQIYMVPVDNISLEIVSVRSINFSSLVVSATSTSSISNIYFSAVVWFINPKLPLSL